MFITENGVTTPLETLSPREFLAVDIFKGKSSEVEGAGGLWLGVDWIRRIRVCCVGGEAPDFSVPHVNHDSSIQLLGSIRSAQHLRAWLEVERIGRRRVGLDGAWSDVRPDGDGDCMDISDVLAC